MYASRMYWRGCDSTQRNGVPGCIVHGSPAMRRRSLTSRECDTYFQRERKSALLVDSHGQTKSVFEEENEKGSVHAKNERLYPSRVTSYPVCHATGSMWWYHYWRQYSDSGNNT